MCSARSLVVRPASAGETCPVDGVVLLRVRLVRLLVRLSFQRSCSYYMVEKRRPFGTTISKDGDFVKDQASLP